jgi:hypothetical protein
MILNFMYINALRTLSYCTSVMYSMCLCKYTMYSFEEEKGRKVSEDLRQRFGKIPFLISF